MYQNQPDGLPHLIDRVFEEKSVYDDFCLALVYRRLFTDARLSTLILNYFFWQKNVPNMHFSSNYVIPTSFHAILKVRPPKPL